MDQIGRKRLRGRLGRAAVWLSPLLNTCPERRLIDFKLVSEDMTPKARAVSIPVYRMRNSGPQDPPVMELKLVNHMMGAGPALCVTDLLPAFGLAESIMRLARRRRPTHCTDPVSHPRNCSSSLRMISCTKAQFSR